MKNSKELYNLLKSPELVKYQWLRNNIFYSFITLTLIKAIKVRWRRMLE